MELKYFSTFTGIGGFELGIKQAYETRHLGLSRIEEGKIQSEDEKSVSDISSEDGNWREQHPVCIGYSEIDKYATQIYKKHFPGHKNYGDITTINASELPNFDLLVGGFPCQSFSIAGKRKGFEDTRGTLFFELARILRDKKPRLFVFENVKGLLSHDNGQTFKTIIATLVELGYDLQWQVLNSKNHGVPQNRERVFIVGHLGGFGGRKVFPIGEDGREPSPVRKEYGEIANAIDTNYWKGADGKITMINLPQAFRVRDVNGVSSTLQGEAGGTGAKTGLYNMGNMKIRRLTPTECERLQGFPDGWTKGISDSQRYKCLGNAVTVNVVSEIIKNIYYE